MSTATELVLLGTAGAPLPVPGRAGISSALIVDDRVFVIDCGRGSPSGFVGAGLGFSRLEAVFLTHLHADHIGDLAGMLLYGWGVRVGAHGPLAPIRVYGPPRPDMVPAGDAVFHRETTIHPELPVPGTTDLVESILAGYAYHLNVMPLDARMPDAGALVRGIDIPARTTRAPRPAGMPAGHEVPVAHACGHDMHMSCLLGMAKLMADHRDRWTGTLIPLFQPAEETGDGAQGMVDDGLFRRIPAPDVALTQHVLPGIAGTVSTRSGPFMATEDSINVTVYGKGGHGAMPQHTIDPVVLAAMIIVRLQTIVSRETPPGEIAVVTVGSVHGGTRSNLIPDHALLQLNLRSYSQQTRERMLASIQRIVRAEGQASGSPRDPDFETVGSFPLTVNDPATTDRVAGAFTAHFGDHALEIDRQTVSEDFSNIPNAAGVPYTYWGLGFTDEKTYRAAEKAGRLQDLPTNHSPKFLPPLQPTLRTGTEALVTAALAWLEPR